MYGLLDEELINSSEIFFIILENLVSYSFKNNKIDIMNHIFNFIDENDNSQVLMICLKNKNKFKFTNNESN